MAGSRSTSIVRVFIEEQTESVRLTVSLSHWNFLNSIIVIVITSRISEELYQEAPLCILWSAPYQSPDHRTTSLSILNLEIFPSQSALTVLTGA